MIGCFNFFWENSSKPLSSSSSISSSFLVCFEWFETWWVHQLRLYKTSLYSRGKNARIKDCKLKILFCFKITHHQALNPLTQNIPCLVHSIAKLKDFCDVGSARWKAFFLLGSFRIRKTMCEDLTSYEFLIVRSLAYLPWWVWYPCGLG